MFRPVSGTGFVEVNEQGEFISRAHETEMKSGYMKPYKEKSLKLSTDKQGYKIINIRRGERRCTYRAHRLVWEAFNGPLSVGDRITFKTADRSNIALNNLELKATKKEESEDQLLLRLESLGMSYEELAIKFHSTEIEMISKCATLRSTK